MIGMLCWVLRMVFPSQKDFNKLAQSSSEKMEFLKMYKASNWTITKEYDHSTEKCTNKMIRRIKFYNNYIIER